MKPVCFDYFRPSGAEEALELIKAHGSEARFLAGGQSLVPMMNFRIARPSALIDLGRCDDLVYLRLEDDRLLCGPMVRQWNAEHDPLVRRECPLIASALAFAGYPTIRNRGTVGGSIAHADPTAELLAVASVLDAEMLVLGPRGERVVPADKFFQSELTTAIGPDEMLGEIRFRREAKGSRSWFGEAGNHSGGMSQVAVAAYVEGRENGAATKARFSVVGLTPIPLRIRSLERAMSEARSVTPLIPGALAADLNSQDIIENIHGSRAYRRAVAVALLQDAVSAVTTGRVRDIPTGRA